MVFHRAHSVAISSLIAFTAMASRAEVPVMESVSRNLGHAQQCLSEGLYAEAQAYAKTTTFEAPVRVSVQGDPSDVTIEALEKWSTALGGQVTFVLASEAEADLNISFKHGVRTSGRDIMGLATTRRSVHAWRGGQFSYQVSGSLEIALFTPGGLPTTRDCLVNTTLHEIGHFLGLDDTMQRGRVMGPIDLDHPITEPSSEEALSLTALQREASVVAEASVNLLAGR